MTLVQTFADFEQEQIPQHVYRNEQNGHYKVWGYLNVGFQLSAQQTYTVIFFWGRIGSTLQTCQKDFVDAREAYHVVCVKLGEKYSKGYVQYPFDKYFQANSRTLIADLFDSVHYPNMQQKGMARLRTIATDFEKINIAVDLANL